MKTPKKKHAINLGIPFKKYMLIYIRGWQDANEATIEICDLFNKMQRKELASIINRRIK